MPSYRPAYLDMPQVATDDELSPEAQAMLAALQMPAIDPTSTIPPLVGDGGVAAPPTAAYPYQEPDAAPFTPITYSGPQPGYDNWAPPETEVAFTPILDGPVYPEGYDPNLQADPKPVGWQQAIAPTVTDFLGRTLSGADSVAAAGLAVNESMAGTGSAALRGPAGIARQIERTIESGPFEAGRQAYNEESIPLLTGAIEPLNLIPLPNELGALTRGAKAADAALARGVRDLPENAYRAGEAIGRAEVGVAEQLGLYKGNERVTAGNVKPKGDVPGDANSMETVFYHGTTQPVGKELQPNSLGLVFVSPSKEEASLFAGKSKDARMVEVRVTTDNIFDGWNPEHLARVGAEPEDRLFDSAYVENADWVKKIKDAGFDGFYTSDMERGLLGTPQPSTQNIALFDKNNVSTPDLTPPDPSRVPPDGGGADVPTPIEKPHYRVSFDEQGLNPTFTLVDAPLTESEIHRAMDAGISIDPANPDAFRAQLTAREAEMGMRATPTTVAEKTGIQTRDQFYEVLSNTETSKKVADDIRRNPDAVRAMVVDGSGEPSQAAYHAYLQLVEAADLVGNKVEAQLLTDAFAPRMTAAGQMIEAARHVDPLSPAMMRLTLKRQVENAIIKKGEPADANRLKEAIVERKVANAKSDSARTLVNATAEATKAKADATALRRSAAVLERKSTNSNALFSEIENFLKAEQGSIRIRNFRAVPAEEAAAIRTRAEAIKAMPDGPDKDALTASLLEEIKKGAAAVRRGDTQEELRFLGNKADKGRSAALNELRKSGVDIDEVEATKYLQGRPSAIDKQLEGRAAYQRQMAKDLEFFSDKTLQASKKRAADIERDAIRSAKATFKKAGVDTTEELAQAFLDASHMLKAMPTDTPAEKLLQHRAQQDLLRDVGKLVPASKVLTVLTEVLNLGKSIAASLDLSWPLRQGMMGVGHPGEWKTAVWDMLKAFGFESAADAVDADVLFGQFGKLRKETELANVDRFGAVGQLEEGFLSKWLGNVLLVGGAFTRSQRAFTTAGNKFRMDAWNSVVRGWLPEAMKDMDFDSVADIIARGQTGKQANDFQELSRALNALTGRSGGKFLEKLSPALTPIFWAPRYAFSRIEAPAMAFMPNRLGGGSASPAIRAMMIRDMLAFAAAVTTPLALIKANGGEVNLDPYSTDFAKGQWKGQKFDYSAGVGLNIRTVFQLIGSTDNGFRTGSVRLPPTAGQTQGRMMDKDRNAVIGDWFRNKLGPNMGLVIDIGDKKDAVGNPVQSPQEIVQDFLNRNLPLTPGDIKEAWDKLGTEAAVTGGIQAMLGVGVSTPNSSIGQAYEAASQRKYGDTAKSLLPQDYRDLQHEPEVAAAIAAVQGKVGLSMETQLKDAGAKWGDFAEKEEAKLKQIIATTTDGKVLKEAIQASNAAKRAVFESHFTPEVQAYSKQGTQQELNPYYRDLWQGADAPEVNGEPDFKARDVERARILKEAVNAGADPKYVTQWVNPATDPQVKAKLQEYHAAQETLRPYWEVKDKLATDNPTWIPKFVDSQTTLARKKYRNSHPDADKALVTWYGYKEAVDDNPFFTPITQSGGFTASTFTPVGAR